MKKLGIILIVSALLISVVSAALLTEYFRDERTVVVEPWMSIEVNNDPREITYGDVTLYDYINVTSHKKFSSTCEIDTEIRFNGDILENQTGIYVSYSKETGSGSLITTTDNTNNGMPEVAIFGTQDLINMGDPDGNYTIRRNININEDLVPGTYEITTILIPYQGN